MEYIFFIAPVPKLLLIYHISVWRHLADFKALLTGYPIRCRMQLFRTANNSPASDCSVQLQYEYPDS